MNAAQTEIQLTWLIRFIIIIIGVYIIMTHKLKYSISGNKLFRDIWHDVLVKWVELKALFTVAKIQILQWSQMDQNKTSDIIF